MHIVSARMLYLVVSCYNDQYSIVITLIRVASKNSVKNCYRASLKCQMMQETIDCMIYDVNKRASDINSKNHVFKTTTNWQHFRIHGWTINTFICKELIWRYVIITGRCIISILYKQIKWMHLKFALVSLIHRYFTSLPYYVSSH